MTKKINKDIFPLLILLTFLIISCSPAEKKKKSSKQIEIEQKIVKKKKIVTSELTFQERQDSLRILLLNSKPNNNLKASILQELYIRALVNQIDNTIKFELPFNLHGLDCGAPDCYSTDITFYIPVKEPIKFPKKVNFKLFEHGCVDKEISEKGIFELVEYSSKYVNYYSKEHKSNLVILGNKKKLYYFQNSKQQSIKVTSIAKIFERFNDEKTNTVDVYQSTIMISTEYENFLINN